MAEAINQTDTRKENMRNRRWKLTDRRTAITVGCGTLVALLLAYMVRPIGLIHEPAMLLYKYPLVWKLPVAVWTVAFLGVGVVPYLFRRKRIKAELAALEAERRERVEPYGRGQLMRPSATNTKRRNRLRRWYVRPAKVAAVPAVIALVFAICTVDIFTDQAIYRHYKFTDIGELPASGKARILPQDVAEQLSSSGYNSSTTRLAQTHIVLDAGGHIAWTFGEVPNGAWRKYTARTQGVATLNAESTARDMDLTEREFEVSTDVQWTDNLEWQAYKKHFLTDVAETVYVVTASGEPVIIAPYIKYVGFWVKVPELAGVYVVHPDGTMEDLSPEEAEERPFIVRSGRMFPEALARQIQESYQYKGGILNRWLTHEDQTEIADTGSNSQPYLMDFGEEGTKWVSTAQPYGKAQATNAIFLTDTITGDTEVWHVPKDEAYTGNSKVLDIVRALSMPGITFSAPQSREAGGKFEAVEPRPVIVNGRFQFMVSVIPNSKTTVTKTVIIDAETNKAVAVFDHDTDPEADHKLEEYLHSGALPTGSGDDPLAVPDLVPGSARGLSDEELQAVMDRLQEANRAQQEAIRALRDRLPTP
jgi:hypothetical protein